MLITIELPNDLAERPDPARDTVEAVALAGYRSGELSAFQARRLLGINSRFEFEVFLKTRGIVEHAYGADDLEEDVRTLRKLEKAG
jgi:predicted HTH domain antitoxin